jgi:hypothetical protein
MQPRSPAKAAQPVAAWREFTPCRTSAEAGLVAYAVRAVCLAVQRIKGRFVKKSELEMYMSQQTVMSSDFLVPAM